MSCDSVASICEWVLQFLPSEFFKIELQQKISHQLQPSWLWKNTSMALPFTKLGLCSPYEHKTRCMSQKWRHHVFCVRSEGPASCPNRSSCGWSSYMTRPPATWSAHFDQRDMHISGHILFGANMARLYKQCPPVHAIAIADIVHNQLLSLHLASYEMVRVTSCDLHGESHFPVNN